MVLEWNNSSEIYYRVTIQLTRKPLLAKALYPYCDWFRSLNQECGYIWVVKGVKKNVLARKTVNTILQYIHIIPIIGSEIVSGFQILLHNLQYISLYSRIRILSKKLSISSTYDRCNLCML